MRDSSAMTDLARRAEPKQLRARQRIDAIIAATQRLLGHRAPGDINTSAVAREAEIPVGSLYRYFPNIYAVYGAIFDRFNEEARAVIERSPQIRAKGWEDELSISIAGIDQLFSDNPSYRALFLLAFTTPQLASLREQWNAQMADHFAAGWSAGNDGFHGEEADVVARMVVETYCAAQVLILRHWDSPVKRAAYSAELMLILKRYLEKYLP